jgi:phospholipid/cholesterol/gamma-HCH transport system substrate-binding protein
VTNTLASVLGSEKGERSVQNIIDNIEGITSDVKATTLTLKKVIGERDEDLNGIVSNLKSGMADLKQFSAGLKDVVNSENRQRFDRILASFDETMVDVKSSAKNINLIVDKVEKGEGTIGKLVNEDTALVELEGAIKDIRKVLSPATKLQVVVDYKSEFRKDDSSQHYFNVRMYTRPDRFYLIGLTDTGLRKRQTDTNVQPSENSEGESSQRTSEEIKDEQRIKFNLQYGKRWYFTTLRFGLFETSGGIAADFHLLSDRAKLSFEAFDWDTQNKTIRRTAHLKAYATVLFYNHLQLLAGIDDPTRTDLETGKTDKDKNYFFGAGVTFNDQDLKAIMGTAALAL